jgi:hypothetical protein
MKGSKRDEGGMKGSRRDEGGMRDDGKMNEGSG